MTSNMFNSTLRVVFCLIILALSGCATSELTSTYNSSPYAPANEQGQKGGTVKYLGDTNGGRQSAYKQMYDSCGGQYLITKEWSEQQYNSFVNAYNGDPYNYSEQIVHLEFQCVK